MYTINCSVLRLQKTGDAACAVASVDTYHYIQRHLPAYNLNAENVVGLNLHDISAVYSDTSILSSHQPLYISVVRNYIILPCRQRQCCIICIHSRCYMYYYSQCYDRYSYRRYKYAENQKQYNHQFYKSPITQYIKKKEYFKSIHNINISLIIHKYCSQSECRIRFCNKCRLFKNISLQKFKNI